MACLVLRRIEGYFEDILEGNEVAWVLGAQAHKLRDLNQPLSREPTPPGSSQFAISNEGVR